MDIFNRTWIIQNALEEIPQYSKGELTIRGLHYRLVARGMTNSFQHYKRVVSAMIKARWDGTISFDSFSDFEREVLGETKSAETIVQDEIESTKSHIKYWLNNYWKNRWENQPIYPEVFVEKKALQGILSQPCEEMDVALSACKGYPSLTFLKEASERFRIAVLKNKRPVILYFGDYDPSGEDIPRSIEQNLYDMGVRVEVKRISLLKQQVIEWNLPPAPAKISDSRTANWDGLGQVELDAVHAPKLKSLCLNAIKDVFDADLYDELMKTETEEREDYRGQLKEFIKNEFKND